MTDFFALFEQPRQPWLDPNALKEKFHQLTRATHPDIHRGELSVTFERINEAYRVLLDPKLRLQHFFALENIAPLTTDLAPPEDLQQLFLRIGTLSQKSQRILAKFGSASDALSRSLVLRDLLPLRSETTALFRELSDSYQTCLGELQQLNELWRENRPQAVVRLQSLADRIAYLARWMSQLQEIEFQFSLR